MSIWIRMKTKKTKGPIELLKVFQILSFIMSIAWISFTSKCIIDLLDLYGLISELPKNLLALTILSWGNSLGDTNADIAMTKKGFGEMAITGTMAGPIFNILIGQGLSIILQLFSS